LHFLKKPKLEDQQQQQLQPQQHRDRSEGDNVGLNNNSVLGGEGGEANEISAFRPWNSDQLMAEAEERAAAAAAAAAAAGRMMGGGGQQEGKFEDVEERKLDPYFLRGESRDI
jgi:hypothetical protein